jgi:ADP-heptose:LPS heptosyltransferase
MRRLQIYEPRERAIVAAADLALAPLGWLRRGGTMPTADVRRVLLLRLERIGDLLMVIDAIRDARRCWPAADIDLVVGSWNEGLARLIPEVTRVETLDVPWLARDAAGASGTELIRRARAWRGRKYDVAINFEPDVRSNFLLWLGGARARWGYWSGGGGAFLTEALEYAPMTHVSDNARTLVARAAGRSLPDAWPGAAPEPRLTVPVDARNRAAARIGAARGVLIGVHAAGGRESKQWHLDRFAAVARELATSRGATIVLTGSDADRALVDVVKRGLAGVPVVDAAGGLDVPMLAGVLARLDLFVTSDTGPMHLAAAVGTPVVALFGPAQPARYGPRAAVERIVRVDLPCSPCGRVRLPPERCRGHVPDCMDGITVAAVLRAANELLDRGRSIGRLATS